MRVLVVIAVLICLAFIGVQGRFKPRSRGISVRAPQNKFGGAFSQPRIGPKYKVQTKGGRKNKLGGASSKKYKHRKNKSKQPGTVIIE